MIFNIYNDSVLYSLKMSFSFSDSTATNYVNKNIKPFDI